MIIKNKKNTLYILVGLVLLVLGTAWLIWWREDSGTSSQNNGIESELNNDVPQQEQPDTSDPNVPDVKEAPNNEQEADLPTSDDPKYVPTISRISQDTENVYVRAYVSTFNEGTCMLEMTKGSESFTAESGVNAQPSYLQCDGFTVSKNEISTGDWTVKVIYKSGGLNYESNEQSFEVS